MAMLHGEAVRVTIIAGPARIGATHAEDAAGLEARLIERTIETGKAAAVGPLTLSIVPDQRRTTYEVLSAFLGVTLAEAPAGTLGTRILAAAEPGPAIVIATVRAALMPRHLRIAAAAVADGVDVALASAGDGLALIAMQVPEPAVFAGIDWNGAAVTAEIRRRLTWLGLSWRELARVATVDVAADCERRAWQGLAALTG
jgi:uncharacterized protein